MLVYILWRKLFSLLNSLATFLLGFMLSFNGFSKWPNGDIGFSIRKVNTSWVQKKWGASVMQLDPNTWILEYRQSLILENSRLFSVTMELLKSCILSGIRRMNEKLCLFSSIWNQYRRFTAREHLQIPT